MFWLFRKRIFLLRLYSGILPCGRLQYKKIPDKRTFSAFSLRFTSNLLQPITVFQLFHCFRRYRDSLFFNSLSVSSISRTRLFLLYKRQVCSRWSHPSAHLFHLFSRPWSPSVQVTPSPPLNASTCCHQNHAFAAKSDPGLTVYFQNSSRTYQQHTPKMATSTITLTSSDGVEISVGKWSIQSAACHTPWSNRFFFPFFFF